MESGPQNPIRLPFGLSKKGLVTGVLVHSVLFVVWYFTIALIHGFGLLFFVIEGFPFSVLFLWIPGVAENMFSFMERPEHSGAGNAAIFFVYFLLVAFEYAVIFSALFRWEETKK